MLSRAPAVAGYFYPADPEALRREVKALAPPEPGRVQAHAVVVPHGSFRHSGGVAGAVFGRVTIPRRCMILGPSHTGSWMPWSVMGEGAYRTPLGEVPIDAASVQALQARCPFLEADAWSQRGEHAIEVQLPLLQCLGPADLSIVPIVMGSDRPEERAQMAQALAQVIRMQEEAVLLIATADLSHYEPQPRAMEQDHRLLEIMTALDGEGVVRYVHDHGITVCGLGAVACVLEAAKQLGRASATRVAYRTSADAGGDPHAVTGYAGLVVR